MKEHGREGFEAEMSQIEERVWQREKVLEGRRLKERMLGGRSSVCYLLPPLPPPSATEDAHVSDVDQAAAAPTAACPGPAPAPCPAPAAAVLGPASAPDPPAAAASDDDCDTDDYTFGDDGDDDGDDKVTVGELAVTEAAAQWEEALLLAYNDAVRRAAACKAELDAARAGNAAFTAVTAAARKRKRGDDVIVID